MFSLVITLDGFNHGGITALDYRRKFGFPEGTKFQNSTSQQKRVMVDEDFARRYFNPERNEESAIIKVDKLRKGDLKLVDGKEKIVLSLTDERAKELFIQKKEMESDDD